MLFWSCKRNITPNGILHLSPHVSSTVSFDDSVKTLSLRKHSEGNQPSQSFTARLGSMGQSGKRQTSYASVYRERLNFLDTLVAHLPSRPSLPWCSSLPRKSGWPSHHLFVPTSGGVRVRVQPTQELGELLGSRQLFFTCLG